jgi:hypothetical protein
MVILPHGHAGSGRTTMRNMIKVLALTAGVLGFGAAAQAAPVSDAQSLGMADTPIVHVQMDRMERHMMHRRMERRMMRHDMERRAMRRHMEHRMMRREMMHRY